jgi:hypothetical protein
VIRFTTKQAMLGTLLTIAAGVMLACAILRVGAQPRGFDRGGYVRTWNDVGQSIDKQNSLLAELQTDVRSNPPGRVRSARRLELLDQIITEHERQLKDFKGLRKAESY